MADDDGVDPFEPCTLGRSQDGDPNVFFKKVNGAGANDLCMMQELTRDSILGNLSDRFAKELVYTWVGDICISVNPFKNVGCVGKSIRGKYKKLGGNESRAQLPPHCYTLVDSTYFQMLTESKSQSILISGESGAGKTEAMKISLTYIAEISASKKTGAGTQEDVPAKLMQTNPIMEAIGNAKTVRNNNSSRFGKHFDLQFKEGGEILGAFTSTYLLEKPRITEHLRGERNYHVFYMVCKADPTIREEAQIENWEKYKICKQDGTIAVVTTWDDNAEFKDMHKAFLLLGMTEKQRAEIYMMMGTCMHLGNIEFTENDKSESSVVNTDLCEFCAGQMQVEEADLNKCLTSRTMGGGVIEFFLSPLDKKRAGLAQFAIVMHMYCLVFDWCVDIVNDAIAVRECDYAIGVLDIFGFENFATCNSFPQLCINFTNESLHNLFIEHVFKLEQETYIREEVQWNFVDYEDNQPTLDLINKRPVCILGLLDEGCATGSATDATVILNFHGAFKDPKKHKNYKTPKKSPDKCFIVNHYAGEVIYTIDGFVEKNKDELSSDIMEMLTVNTKFESLKLLAVRDAERKADADAEAAAGKKKGGGGKKKKTVGRTFGDSLKALMEKLGKTQHHYIRCLKPNQTLKAGDWDNEFMFKQLAYSGTLEVTEIRKAGLNVRRPLQHFFRYYKLCADDQSILRAGTVTKRCELLLTECKIDPNKWRVGKTLVFLKDYEILDDLDKLREVKIIGTIIQLQSYFRMCVVMQRFRLKRRMARRIQDHFKTQAMSAAFQELRNAALIVQKWGRSYAWRAVVNRTKAGDNCTYANLIKNLDQIRPAGKVQSKEKINTKGKKGGSIIHGHLTAALMDATLDPALVRMRAKHKGWLHCTLIIGGEEQTKELLYVFMNKGVLTTFTDDMMHTPHDTFPLADCKIKGEGDILILEQPLAMQPSMTKEQKKEIDPDDPPPLLTHLAKFEADNAKASEAGMSKKDVIAQWKQRLEEAIGECQEMDDFLIDPDGSPEPVDKLLVMKEGFLHSKSIQHDIMSGDDHIEAGRWQEVPWDKYYFVLYNNGKVHAYADDKKEKSFGCINLRCFALEESEEEFEDDDKKEAEEKKKGGKNKKDEEIEDGEAFYMMVKGKAFELLSGRTIIRCAHANKDLVDDWLNMLRLMATVMYQKSPIFVQAYCVVNVMNSEEPTLLAVEENTRVRLLVERICKEFKINNTAQWAFFESWTADIDIPGTHGMRRRKVPNRERVIDELFLSWEIATRKRYGMVAGMAEEAFKLTLCKGTSIVQDRRSKEEMMLEYAQALEDMKSGRFHPMDESEIFDLCALSWFIEMYNEASEEGGGATLASTDINMTAATMMDNELKYLPYSFADQVKKKGEEWCGAVATAFQQIIHDEIKHDEGLPKVREITADHRMIEDPTALGMAEVYIDRVRRSAQCFAFDTSAELWSAEKTYRMKLLVNHTGLAMMTQEKNTKHIATFGFTDSLISWLTTDDNMLTVYVVHKASKKAAKLHFVTPEAGEVQSLLAAYSGEVLSEQKKMDKELANRGRAQAKLLENQLTA